MWTCPSVFDMDRSWTTFGHVRQLWRTGGEPTRGLPDRESGSGPDCWPRDSRLR